ncbi:MAG: PEGA domain-containing protein [Methanomicrobiales archaeon]|nr:PEGA domain-containing protein [Methanomicrobiales archaeon]
MRFSTVLLFLILIAGISGMVCAQTETIVPGSDHGYFSFNSVPSGADVVFDGIYQGETPVVVEVAVSGNPQHRIEMTRDGYESWSSTHTGNPAAGEAIPITATLVPSSRVGSIMVTSNPSGAEVILDDSRIASTPYTYTNISTGTHAVSFFLSGYEIYYSPVNVLKGVTTQVFADLDPDLTIGSLSVTSSPSGASVYVDHVYRGVTTVVLGNLQDGTHLVLLVKAGYYLWQNNVKVTAGMTTHIDAKLEADPAPVYGTVSIMSNPPGADVYADGNYIGRTRLGGPLVFILATPGTHSVRLTKFGYQDDSGTATVVAGQDYEYNINLKAVPNPTTGSISVTSSPIGAEVHVNNVFRGLSPLTVDGITPGSYTVALKLIGYENWQSTVNVTAGQTAPISASLLPTQTPAPTESPGPAPALVVVITIAGAALFLRKHS